jgi:hypothetical protein
MRGGAVPCNAPGEFRRAGRVPELAGPFSVPGRVLLALRFKRLRGLHGLPDDAGGPDGAAGRASRPIEQ